MIRCLLAVALVALLPGAAWACLPGFEGTKQSRSNGITVAYKSQPAPIPVGQPFVLEIAVCPAPRALELDAHMPAHRHGMNYRPSITNPSPGLYRAEGLVLHMPGEWEFVFEVGLPSGARQRLTSPHLAQ